jgi:5-formyltetrahydrofolate cyclo-ligase
MRAAVAALTPEERRAASEALCARLALLETLRGARTVLLYLPLPREIDLLPFGRRLLASGAVVAVPRMLASGARGAPGTMEAVAVESLPSPPMQGEAAKPGEPSRSGDEEAFARDALGVRSPLAGRSIPIAAIDAMIVPALAYDLSGNRLGRGGGYYDRFLAARAASTVVIGVVFDRQLVNAVPSEPYDIRVQIILTDRRLVHAPGC